MFGIWGHKKATEITYYGLHSMQHRGQDGAGIVVNNGEELKVHKDMGLVNDVFKSVDFEDFTGTSAVGHVRNATQDTGVINNVQPLAFHSLEG
ncbi:MAG TPA: amidophosphoribosyltransferase, partial [Pseudogracilibacillus sp.]|nr:amidophosphoribosyltransferase [Pseudogracilibacillus sp.]